jgi:Holliday junction DNA helicase RuvB
MTTTTIRPQSFSDFYGQRQIVEYLVPAVKSAKVRKAHFAHTLLCGSAGLGKTTLGQYVIPNELGVSRVMSLNCAAVERPAHLLSVLTSVPEGGVLFLDEIHRLTGQIQDYLLTVMEDQKLTITIEGASGPSVVSIDLPYFTIIGATTRIGSLNEPMRDRFAHQLRLQLYDDTDMALVLRWVGQRHGVFFSDSALSVLVPSCHGTARYAVRFVNACIDTLCSIDCAAAVDVLSVDEVVADTTLRRLGFDPATGLSGDELRLLKVLATNDREYAGLNTLSAMLDEDAKTVEDVYEPWLIFKGYMARDARGRTLTQKGRSIL